MFPRVTHPCATKSEDFVRLACVRPAASVRSEPGSNSQVDLQMIRRSLQQSSSKAEITRLLCKMRFPASDQSDTGRRRLRIPSLRLHFVKERRTRRPSSPAPSAFASSAVPVAGRPVYSRTTSPASTSFFRPLRNFSEAFRGVGCSPLPPPKRHRPAEEAGVLQERPNHVKPFFHQSEPKPEPVNRRLNPPARHHSGEARVIGLPA
jgi:hypothetical protein